MERSINRGAGRCLAMKSLNSSHQVSLKYSEWLYPLMWPITVEKTSQETEVCAFWLLISWWRFKGCPWTHCKWRWPWALAPPAPPKQAGSEACVLCLLASRCEDIDRQNSIMKENLSDHKESTMGKGGCGARGKEISWSNQWEVPLKVFK